MSILSALKQQNSSIDDLAALPQAMIMQMAQKKQISEEMLAPILARKAELAEAFARESALKNSGKTPPTIVEQLMAQNAQAEQPQHPMHPQMAQPMPPQMPQAPEEAGVAQLPVPERQYAGGGIIAFADGGMSDYEDDDYEDALEEADYDAMIERAMNAGEYDTTPHKGIQHPHTPHTGMGITAGRPVSGDLESRLRSTIMGKESGGKRYDKNGNLLTSSKGAQGEMQVMPATATNPGFGIKPAQSNHPDELKRVGDEYASVLLRRYRDPKLAMIAYNMGPGATDKWLASGADPRKLPKETQGYIGGVNLAKGGEVRHFANDGYVSFGEEVPYDESQDWGLKDWWKRNTFGTKENIQANKPAPKKTTAAPVATAPSAEPKKQAVIPTPTENIIQAAPEQAAEAPKNRFDAYMEKMLAREDAMEKQKAMDKHMALLTAGLGMLGGTSQYALENIGKGALAGVQQYGESNKQRAAEQAALDKSMLYAHRYQSADELARQNAEYSRGLKGAQLEETRRANTNREMEHAQSNLNNYLKVQQDLLKSRFPAGEADPNYINAMNQIYQSAPYRALAQRAGFDVSSTSQTFPGFSAKMR